MAGVGSDMKVLVIPGLARHINCAETTSSTHLRRSISELEVAENVSISAATVGDVRLVVNECRPSRGVVVAGEIILSCLLALGKSI